MNTLLEVSKLGRGRSVYVPPINRNDDSVLITSIADFTRRNGTAFSDKIQRVIVPIMDPVELNGFASHSGIFLNFLNFPIAKKFTCGVVAEDTLPNRKVGGEWAYDYTDGSYIWEYYILPKKTADKNVGLFSKNYFADLISESTLKGVKARVGEHLMLSGEGDLHLSMNYSRQEIQDIFTNLMHSAAFSSFL